MSGPLRIVIGTAGHVDHGKTALVKALTGIDTDRLPEEKRRGITLEAGYAHLELPGIGTAGVVDVPGHERFLRAMVGAAFGVDIAVLCVAADEGPMPQTAEHLDVLRLLGVHAGVIALTKSDLLPALGSDHRELLLLELKELVSGSFLEDAPVVECSARTGQGLPELVRSVAQAVRAQLDSPRSDQGPLFLPLDRSFGVKGFGTVVTGTLFSGALQAGDEVDIVGSGAKARGVRVRGVQVHGQTVPRAQAGQRTAANLAAIEVSDAPRGAALVAAGTLEATGPAHVVDVELELLPWAARPLKDRARVLAHVGTAQAQAVVALVDRAQLVPGERALAQLRLGMPAAAIAGLRFLLRAELGKPVDAAAAPPGRLAAAARAHASTIGGGRILSVAPRRRRRRDSDVKALEALAGDDVLAQAEQLVLESGHLGCSPARLAARGAFTFKTADRALERLAQLGRAAPRGRAARASHRDAAANAAAPQIARGQGPRRQGERRALVRRRAAPRSAQQAGPAPAAAWFHRCAGLQGTDRPESQVHHSPRGVVRQGTRHAADRGQARPPQGTVGAVAPPGATLRLLHAERDPHPRFSKRAPCGIHFRDERVTGGVAAKRRAVSRASSRRRGGGQADARSCRERKIVRAARPADGGADGCQRSVAFSRRWRRRHGLRAARCAERG